MALIFKTPTRMASFPAKVPVYKTCSLPSPKMANEYWRTRLLELGDSLQFKDSKTVDERDYIFAVEGTRTLQLFKASDSFLYYDGDLVCPEVEDKEMMLPKKARDLAISLIKSQKLVGEDLPNKQFQTYYAGHGYTLAQTANAGYDKNGDWDATDETDLYKTEIRSHFGYLLGGLPVFGPGAKTIVSHVGNEISEEMHYWRKPGEIAHEWEIIAPQTAISRLCKDKYFVKVAKANKNYPGMSSGRFYDDVTLGYYATPPTNKQRYYLPVYKIRGTFESRENSFSLKSEHITETKKTFRHDFVHFVSALSGDAAGLGISDFRRQVIF